MSNEDSVHRTLGYLERLLEEQARRHVSREEERSAEWTASESREEPTGDRAADAAADDREPGPDSRDRAAAADSRPQPDATTAGPQPVAATDEPPPDATTDGPQPDATTDEPQPGGLEEERTSSADARTDTPEATEALEEGDEQPGSSSDPLEPEEGDVPEPVAAGPSSVAGDESRGPRAVDENEATLELPPMHGGGASPEEPTDDLAERRSRGGNGVQPYRRLTTRLGTLLLDEGLISNSALDRALAEHRSHGERLGHYLVDQGMVREADLVRVLARQYGVPAADLDSVEVDAKVLELVPVEMARRYLVVPISVDDDALDVAMVDPTDVVAIANLKFATGRRPQPLIATERAVLEAIRRLYRTTGTEERPKPEEEDLGPREVRRALRRLILARDQAVMDLETDPRAAYRLAVQVDDLVEQIISLVADHLSDDES